MLSPYEPHIILICLVVSVIAIWLLCEQWMKRRSWRAAVLRIAVQTVEDVECPDPSEIAQLVSEPHLIYRSRRIWIRKHVSEECVECGQAFLRFTAVHNGSRRDP